MEESLHVVNTTAMEEGIMVVYQYFFERQILAALLISSAVLGLVGNSFVILAVAWNGKLRTPTNAFVVNLAVADTLTCAFVPWQAVAVLGEDAWAIPGAPWLCTAAGFVVVVTIGCSVNSLALIAVNRWVGITKSRYTTRRIYTARKLAVMVAVSWAVPLCCALAPILTDFGELGFEPLYSTCSWVRSNPYTNLYNTLIAAVLYPIQLSTITISYVSIFCYVRKTSHETIQANVSSISARVDGGRKRDLRRKLWRRQVDVTKNMLYIVVAFVVCITPYFLALVVYADWSYRLVPWSAAILASNSSINPVIYATSHPDFRKAFRRFIRCRQWAKGDVESPGQSTDNLGTSEDMHRV